MQVTSIVSTFPMLPRGHARRSPHGRHTVVCRYLSLLCGIHHIASPGQRLHCQRPTSHSVAMLYARLVRRHHLYAGHDLALVVLSLSFSGRTHRRPLLARRFSDDFLLVHEARESSENGNLACRQYHFQCHLRLAGCGNSYQHGQRCWDARLAVVSPPGRYVLFPSLANIANSHLCQAL